MKNEISRDRKKIPTASMSHVDSILSSLRKNAVEKHEPLVEKGQLLRAVTSCKSEDYGDLVIIKRIGLGTHAEVYEVRPVLPQYRHITLAAKIEKPIRQAAGFIVKEIEVLSSLSGVACVPKIVSVYSTEIGGTSCVCFTMELFNDSLSSLKTSKAFVDDISRLKVEFLEFIATEMFKAVFMLHDHNFLHRDLKPSNYMYKLSADGSMRIALVDFGSSIRTGESNESEFRGTGAYGPVISDPMISKPIDDLWSATFSVLDLCIPGGLPWRSLSARTAEGRDEIVSKKAELLNAIAKDDTINPIVANIPGKIKTMIQSLIEAGDDESRFRGNFQYTDSPGSQKIQQFISTYLEPPLARVTIPRLNGQKTNPLDFLLSGSNRSLLVDSIEPPNSNSSTFLKMSGDETLSKISAILHTAACGNLPPGPASDGQRICVSELVTANCNYREDCPLLHIPRTGIARSAVVRALTVRNKICIEALFSGKCYSRACLLLHLTDQMLDDIYSGDSKDPSKKRSRIN
jgi:serine/threonine protein kinase